MNHVCVLANNQINYKVFSICFLFSFKFFLHLLCISLVPLIFPYSAQILLENALLGRQNARLKNRLLCSKFYRQNLSKPNAGAQNHRAISRQEKMAFSTPSRVVLRLLSPSPRVCTDVR